MLKNFICVLIKNLVKNLWFENYEEIKIFIKFLVIKLSLKTKRITFIAKAAKVAS